MLLLYLHELLKFRFVLIGYEMNEKNFVLMHKEVVYQVQSKCNMPTVINMLKINQLLIKKRKISFNDEEYDPINPDPQDSTSAKDISKCKKVPVAPPKKNKTM